MSLITPDVEDLIRTATKAAVAEALARASQPVELPGTVETFDPGTQLCNVVIDGDDDATPGLPNMSGSWPHRGSRVMVKFQPPRGMAVSRVHKPQGAPQCNVTSAGSQTLVATTTTILTIDQIDGMTDYFELLALGDPSSTVGGNSLRVLVPGWYSLGGGVQGTAGAAGGRRFAGLAISGVTTRLGLQDVNMGAATQWIATGILRRELQAGDELQIRVQSGTAIDVFVSELSAEWKAQRTTVS